MPAMDNNLIYVNLEERKFPQDFLIYLWILMKHQVFLNILLSKQSMKSDFSWMW